ncbi:coiled-coil domain-containing protein 172-like [Anneissia japonica]|uniref:coiled-coil domain-containing protein 172-like n=1 Tax=Anneissia japonica TaxID=1529436 RepID=UPI001425864A|nr:coiled-coil domain-containing protein 172-like [Anneissia japonica]
MNLSELFVQILESEQKAEERKYVLNDLKRKIGSTRVKLEEIQEQRSSVQGQLLLKTNKLSEEELNLQWYISKKNILKEQLNEIQTANKRLIENLSSVRERHEDGRKIFQEELARFNREYDLQGSGKMGRERQAQTEIENLKKQEQQLKEEMSQFREHTKILNELTKEKESRMMEIYDMEKRMKDLDEVVLKEEEEISNLKKEKNDVANKAHSCTEFKRLQNELESCQDDALESVCAALQLELDELQRSLWQKQLHSRSTEKLQQRKSNNLRTHQTWGKPINNRHSCNKTTKQSCFKWTPPMKTSASVAVQKLQTAVPSELPKPNLRKLRQEMQKKIQKQQVAPNFDLQLDDLLEDFEDLDEITLDEVNDTKPNSNNNNNGAFSQGKIQTNTVMPTQSKKVRFR